MAYLAKCCQKAQIHTSQIKDLLQSLNENSREEVQYEQQSPLTTLSFTIL